MDEKLKAELLAARNVVAAAKKIKLIRRVLYSECPATKIIKIDHPHNDLLDVLNEYDKVIK